VYVLYNDAWCRWDKKPLKNRDTVGLPLVVRLAEACRGGAMLLTHGHALMGFGTDPKPAQPPPPPSQPTVTVENGRPNRMKIMDRFRYVVLR